jgi:hypothetical protein
LLIFKRKTAFFYSKNHIFAASNFNSPFSTTIQHFFLTMNLKQSLHSLLADNETAEVITQLLDATQESSPDLYAEVEQISARFEANIDQSRTEFADELSTNRESAKIKYLLLSVINRLPEDAELPSAVKAKRLKIAGLIVLGVAILGLVAYNFDFFKKNETPTTETPKSVVQPVVETPKTVVATPATPAVAPVSVPSVTPIVLPTDTLKKLDTLVKKKIRRIKKAPVVPPTEPYGISQ